MEVVNNHPFGFAIAIKEILEKEAPLAEEYLLKRICHHYGREKVTSVVLQDFNYDMIGCGQYGILRKDGFLYLKDNTDYHLRIPGDKREIKYISLEELAAGFYVLIEQNISIEREGLFRRMCNLLGFLRLGNNIVTRFEEALQLLITDNQVRDEGGVLSVI